VYRAKRADGIIKYEYNDDSHDYKGQRADGIIKYEYIDDSMDYTGPWGTDRDIKDE
jgi:hypothetical protein